MVTRKLICCQKVKIVERLNSLGIYYMRYAIFIHFLN